MSGYPKDCYLCSTAEVTDFSIWKYFFFGWFRFDTYVDPGPSPSRTHWFASGPTPTTTSRTTVDATKLNSNVAGTVGVALQISIAGLLMVALAVMGVVFQLMKLNRHPMASS